MIKNILFDLDGTLLAQDQEQFLKDYYKALTSQIMKLGYKEMPFLNGLNNGVKAMLLNDGTQTNDESFWDTFTLFSEIDRDDIEDHFYDFYVNEFQEVGKGVVPYVGLKECLESLKEKGYRLILATNPLFPSVATASRVRWAGLDTDLFEHITTYENSKYSKPNPLYYKEILDNLNLNPDETLMVGNDVEDDSPITQFGVSLYIVTNNLINRNNKELPELNSDMNKLIEYLNALESLIKK